MSTPAWPTPLADDGSAPPVKDLLAAGDLHLARQTGYLLAVARRLTQLKHEIDAFQLPIGDVAAPLVTKFEGTVPTVVFTWSEPWDDAAVRGFDRWHEWLFAGGLDRRVPLAVVSNHDCPALADREGLTFVRMGVRGLAGDEPEPEPGPEAASVGTVEEAQQLAVRFRRMIREQTDVDIDWRPDALDRVDAAIDTVRDGGVPEDEASGMLRAAGSYVGEVLVRHAGAAWRPTGELGRAESCPWPLMLELPDGRILDPVGAAFDRFRQPGGPGAVALGRAAECDPG